MQGPGWFKIGSDGRSIPANPNVPYGPDEEDIEALQRFMLRVIPSASRGKLVAVDCCMYDMTPDEDFILDKYPGSDRIIIGSGFSGHGFKFGVLIGELLAALTFDEEPAFPLDSFRLSRFSQSSGH
jgi:glycine/D-amino acid oxidase-like deaminating enzyme